MPVARLSERMRDLMRITHSLRWSVLSLAVIATGAWTQNPPPKSAPAAKSAQTATQFYLEYRKVFDKATKVDDILPYLDAKTVAQIKATPAAERAQNFELIKMFGAMSDVKVTKEGPPAANGTVVLTCEGTDPDTKGKKTGSITIVKEAGAWKMSNEEWQ